MIEKWTNGSQDIYCLSDEHNSSLPHNKICNQQRIDIVNAAKKLNGCVIAEDLNFYTLDELIKNPLQFDPNENHIKKVQKEILELNNIEIDVTPLIGLTAHCHYVQVPVDNIEFRHLKIVSIFDGLIDGATALAFSDTIRNNILSYNDSPELNNYYAKKIDEYITTILNPCTNFLNQVCKRNCSLKEALPYVSYDPKLETIHFLQWTQKNTTLEEKKRRILVLYDTVLIDLRITHSIYTHKKYPALFVCAGGGHIKRIQPALKLIGFTQVDSYCDASNAQPQEPTAINIDNYFASKKPNNWSVPWLESLLSFF